MIQKEDLQFWNSVTKYPSILTYHLLDKKNNITENLHPIATCREPLFAFEKIDGTNCRIILLPEKDGKRDFLIGSREDILTENYPDGDVSRGIVDTATLVADRLVSDLARFSFPPGVICLHSDAICLYGEVYGGNIRH